MSKEQSHQEIRMQVWVEAWTLTAASDSCIKLETPTIYADKCLEEFDKRFPEGFNE